MFQSGFRTQLQRYVALKRALGRAYTAEAPILRDWDALISRRQGQRAKVDQKLFDLWWATLTPLCPREPRRRLTIVRNFLLFDARRRPTVFLPDPATFPTANPPRPPRLVTQTEMARVLATTAQLPPRPNQPLRAATARLAFVLLFCCGLRRGELLRLKLQNVELAPGLLRIEATKFHKFRLVPLSPSVAGELRDYLERRRQHRLATLPDHPLIWSGGPPAQPTAYTGTGLARMWQHLCLTVGMVDDRGRPPRLHDLRHGFAVAALQRWYAQDGNVQARLPLLATYLGHVSPASTHYYLQWTPALREATSRRFHQGFGPLLLPGGNL